MELKTFVAETLKQIIDGVAEAQEYAKSKRAVINPAATFMTAPPNYSMGETDDPAEQQVIEFDVAVTTAEGDESKGGMGIFVGSFGIGAQGQTSANTQSISRVKFSVPVLLPVQKRGK